MGIFDKKTKGRRGEEFDSPVERIDLSASPENKDEAAEGADGDKKQVDAKPEQTEDAKEGIAEAVSTKDASGRVEQDYGIEEAIALMRTLPADSVELVVSVVKHTLESTHIDIPTIILDAGDKQERITKRIAVLREEISGLEKEIATRTDEISALEADHEETSLVRERLELAEKLGKKEQPKAGAKPGSKLPAPKSART